MTETPQRAIAAQLQWQADACRMIGSELYAGLLERAAADVAAGGPTWEILRGHEQDPRFSVLGLRLMGCGQPAGADRARAGSRRRLPQRATRRELGSGCATCCGATRPSCASPLDRPVQTNEVGRCAALVFGFLAVAEPRRACPCACSRSAPAPVSTCAGTATLRSERFSWGPDGSPVRLEFELEGQPAPSCRRSVEIAEPPRLRRDADRSHHPGGPPHPAHLHLARPESSGSPACGPRSRSPRRRTSHRLDREPAAAWAGECWPSRRPARPR